MKKAVKKKPSKNVSKKVKSKKLIKSKHEKDKKLIIDGWGEGIPINEIKAHVAEYKVSSEGFQIDLRIDEKIYNQNGEEIPSVDDVVESCLQKKNVKFPKDNIPVCSIKLWERHEVDESKIYPSSSPINNRVVSIEFNPDIFKIKGRYEKLRPILYTKPKDAIEYWKSKGIIPKGITVGRKSKQLERLARYHSRLHIYREITNYIYKTITKSTEYRKNEADETYRTIHKNNSDSIIKDCLLCSNIPKIQNWVSKISGRKNFHIDRPLLDKMYKLAYPKIGTKNFNFEYIEKKVKKKAIEDSADYEGMSLDNFKRDVLRGTEDKNRIPVETWES